MLWCLVVASLFACSLADPAKEDSVVRFEELDKDGNSEITYNEFEQWHKKDGRQIDDHAVKELFQKHDRNRDSVLSISEFVPLAFALSHKPAHQTEAIFKKIDLNGDGIVTRDEAKKSEGGLLTQIIEGVFQVADMNRDGEISLAEFSAVVDNSNRGRPKTQQEQDMETAQRLLALIDQNGDRKLNVQEVHAFANINSKVSEEEVLTAFKFLDLNQDGWIAIDELANLPNKMAELVRFKEAPLVWN